MPTIELSLLRKFNTHGKTTVNLFPGGLIDAIFQENPLLTLEKLYLAGLVSGDMTVGVFKSQLDAYIAARRKTEIVQYKKRKEAKVKTQIREEIKKNRPLKATTEKNKANIIARAEKKEQEYILNYDKKDEAMEIWNASHPPSVFEKAITHRFWLTVYARCVFPSLMSTNASRLGAMVLEKCDRFKNNQIPLMRYMDTLADTLGRAVLDSDVDPDQFMEKYKELGYSYYPDDAKWIDCKTVCKRNKPSPRQMLLNDLGVKILSLNEQAQIVHDSVHRLDMKCISWLIKGTQHVDTTEEEQFKHDLNVQLQTPWIKCKKFESTSDILKHTIWAGMLITLHQLDVVRNRHDIAMRYKDAAYAWQLSFIELIDICQLVGRYDDVFLRTTDTSVGLSPLEFYYPWDERAFLPGDLPDFGSTLAIIPLYGEKLFPRFDLGKLFNKSLNFACVRRSLTEAVRDDTRKSKGLWKVFSRIMWCMLMGLYPGDKIRQRGDEALRIKRLCDSMDMMNDKLEIDEDKSCSIIFTAFRSYISYYGSLNKTYAVSTAKYINWHDFVSDTRIMAEYVRGGNLCQDDMFAEPRILLERHKKATNDTVYRYRTGCLSEELYSIVSSSLEKNSYTELEWCRSGVELFRQVLKSVTDFPAIELTDAIKESLEDRDYFPFLFSTLDYSDVASVRKMLIAIIKKTEIKIESYKRFVPEDIKVSILNLMLKMPEEYRFELVALNMLTEARYGGLCSNAPKAIRQLVRLYYKRAAPKELDEQIAELDTYDLEVLTWYIHCARLFDRIHLIPLDYETNNRIELAMKADRLRLYPGVQELTDRDFEVWVTICCEKVVTERGSSLGHDGVRYNIRDQSIICKRTKRLKRTDFSQLAPTKKAAEVTARARMRKTELLHIPCDKQPVLRICIRGCKLQTGSHRKTKKQYMFCPECACFDQVKLQGYLGDGIYKCVKCLSKDKTIQRVWKCAYCSGNIPPVWKKRAKASLTGPQGDWIKPCSTVKVMRLTGDEKDLMFNPVDSPAEILQDIFFCSLHYKLASTLTKQTANYVRWGKNQIYMEKNDLIRRMNTCLVKSKMKSSEYQLADRGIQKK